MGKEVDIKVLAREIAEEIRSLARSEYPPILTVDQAAVMMQLDRNTVYELIRQGKIPAFKAGRVIRINRDQLLQIVAEGERREAVS